MSVDTPNAYTREGVLLGPAARQASLVLPGHSVSVKRRALVTDAVFSAE